MKLDTLMYQFFLQIYRKSIVLFFQKKKNIWKDFEGSNFIENNEVDPIDWNSCKIWKNNTIYKLTKQNN